MSQLKYCSNDIILQQGRDSKLYFADEQIYLEKELSGR